MLIIKTIPNLLEIKKVLIIQFKPFGDVFLSSCIFETIKNELPQIKLTYLVFHPFQVTVIDHPFVDNLIIYKKEKGVRDFISRVKLYQKIRKQKFDLVIDLQNNPGSQQVALFSGAKYRVGYNHGQFAFVYNFKSIEGKVRYAASRRFDILKPLGIKESSWRFYYIVKENAKEYIDEWLKKNELYTNNFIVLSPGSPVLKRKWENQSWAELADIIINKIGIPVIFLWAKNELTDCEIILKMMKNKAILAPPTDLNQAAALLLKTKLLICNDGGLNHISSATETKTIAIFGNTDPKAWSPAEVFSHHHHVYNENHKDINDNTFGVTPTDVYNKVMEVL